VSVSGVEGNRLDLRECGEDVMLIEELINSAAVVGSRCSSVSVLHTDGILHEPFVDGLCGMGHVDTASKVRFGEDVW